MPYIALDIGPTGKLLNRWAICRRLNGRSNCSENHSHRCGRRAEPRAHRNTRATASEAKGGCAGCQEKLRPACAKITLIFDKKKASC